LRGGVDLLDFLLDLGVATLQPGLVLGEGPLHLGDLALPIDELLAEGGHGQAMLVLPAPQGLFLLLEPIDVELDAGPQPFQLVLALADILVNLGQVIAELSASLGQAVEPGADAQLDLGELFEQAGRLAPHRLELGPLPTQPFQGLLLLAMEAVLGVVQGQRFAGELLGLGAVRLFAPRLGRLLTIEVGRPSPQLVLKRRQALDGIPLIRFRPGPVFDKIRGRLLLRLGFVVEGLLADGELLGTAAQLLLQSLASRFAFRQGDGSLAQGLTLRIDTLLRFGELRHAVL
jgi:hypothetical protein